MFIETQQFSSIIFSAHTSIKKQVVTCSICEVIVSPEEKSSSSVGCWVCDSWRCWNINGDDLCVSTGFIDPDEPGSGWSLKLHSYIQTIHIKLEPQNNCMYIVEILSHVK